MLERNDKVWQPASVSNDFLEGMRGAIPLAAEQLAIMVCVIQGCNASWITGCYLWGKVINREC
jgi:hypothetical protein